MICPIKKQSITQLPNAVFKELGWDYFVSAEAEDYLTSELLVVRPAESDAFYAAGNRLYELFVAAAEHVMAKNLLPELGIPKNLHSLIRHTWEDDRHLHLFGRNPIPTHAAYT